MQWIYINLIHVAHAYLECFSIWPNWHICYKFHCKACVLFARNSSAPGGRASPPEQWRSQRGRGRDALWHPWQVVRRPLAPMRKKGAPSIDLGWDSVPERLSQHVGVSKQKKVKRSSYPQKLQSAPIIRSCPGHRRRSRGTRPPNKLVGETIYWHCPPPNNCSEFN
jgi:hypothetical protein